VIQIQAFNKVYRDLEAVRQLTLTVEKGDVFGLIGPNGAGKTTLFNVVNGVYPATAGRVRFRGEDVTQKKPYEMAHAGLARTHQIVRPLNELSVIDNVMVGACFGRHSHGLGEARRIAGEVLDFVSLGDRAEQLAGSLNVGQKKRLELARALASQPHLLFLDEVLAGLNPSEIAGMVDIVKQIRKRDITIIMIEHVMHAVMNVSDRIIVLDYGQLIAEGTPEEIANNPKVIEAYLGDPKLAESLMSEEA